jgi:hypothetical protein
MSTRLAALAVFFCVVAALPVSAQQTKPPSLQKTGDIDGQVTYCGQQSNTGALAYIPGESFQARLSASGRFALHYVPIGTYSVVIEIPGRPPHTLPTVVVADSKITNLGTINICFDNDGDGSTEDVDCNDNNPAIHPGANEACDTVDNDCDGTVDEGCTLCTDADLDGFYAQAGCNTVIDCNDNSALIRPGAAEVCDNVDNNCSGTVDEGIDFSADPANCGACGQVCSFPNGEAACVNGQCSLVSCEPGFAHCDSALPQGCETSLFSVTNCGACGNVCAGAPNSTSVCISGQCGADCFNGFENCNGDLLDGCEADVANNVQNCGSCGQACGAGQVCVNAQCFDPASAEAADGSSALVCEGGRQ